MNNTSKRVQGAIQEVRGRIKFGLGKLVGHERTQAEGHVDMVKGAIKQEAAKAGEQAKGKIEELVGSVKSRVGELVDDKQLELEGRAKGLQGQARQAITN
jgi:uncharacterized protein YjbJ (UPF0337 family)